MDFQEEQRPQRQLWRIFLRKMCCFVPLVLELHGSKLVSLMVVSTCIYSGVSAINCLLLVAMAISMVFSSLYWLLVLPMLLILAAIVFICLASVLPWVNAVAKETPLFEEQDCDSMTCNSTAQWLGLTAKTWPTSLVLYSPVFCALLLQWLAKLLICGNKHLRGQAKYRVLFTEVGYTNSTEDLLSCIKYMVNYGMHNFGLETCGVMSAICMVTRQDAFACMYGVLLVLPLYCSRRLAAALWRGYCMLLAIAMCCQYALLVGPPPFLGSTPYIFVDCNELLALYLCVPTTAVVKEQLVSNMGKNLLVDYLQLHFACCQLRAFKVDYEGQAEEEMTAIRDFISAKLSLMDYARHFVYLYAYWLTLACVFAAGLSSVSLLHVGSLFAAFHLLNGGYHWLCKSRAKLLTDWNVLVLLSHMALLLSACLQLFGCVWLAELGASTPGCIGIKLVALRCAWHPDRYASLQQVAQLHASCLPAEPHTPALAAGTVWQVLCLGMLLLQRRVFQSDAFQQVVATELHAQRCLTARGAKYFNAALRAEVVVGRRKEQLKLEMIRRRVLRLRTRKCSSSGYQVDERTLHMDVVYGGGPQMFDDDSDLEELSDEAEVRVTHESAPQPNPLDIVNATFRGGLAAGLSVAIAKSSNPVITRHSRLVSADFDLQNYDCVIERDSDDDEPTITSQDDCVYSPSTEAAPVHQNLNAATCSMETQTVLQTSATALVKKDYTLTRKLVMLVWHMMLSLVDWLTVLLKRSCRSYNAAAKNVNREISAVKRHWLTNYPVQEACTRPLPCTADLERLLVQDSEWRNEMLAINSRVRDFKLSHSRLLKVLLSLTDCLVAHWDKVCFAFLILNHLISASALSLPYALLVFLYGMLCVPRPTHNYWRVTIFYTMFVIAVKYAAQFPFEFLNKTLNAEKAAEKSEDALWWPRLVGVEQKTSYAVIDLLQLVFLCVQKALLKRYGLWRDESDEDWPLPFEKHGQTEYDQTDQVSNVDNVQVTTTTASKPEKSLKNRFKAFFQRLNSTEFSWFADVYVYMFFFEFVSLLVIAFGYRGFAPDGRISNDIATFIRTNELPIPFTLMLLCQFLVVIIDRCIFLYRNVPFKLVLHVVLVLAVHGWIFFAVPGMTMVPFGQNAAAIVFYILKCCYFTVSAYQIRAGYPRQVLGNFLAQGYNLCNKIAYKCYMLIPFLFEFRTLLDWICVPTSLSFYHWLYIEDARYTAFCRKVDIVRELAAPQIRGERVSRCDRIGMLLSFIGLCLLVWVPVFVFSFSTTVHQANPPVQFNLKVTLNGFQPIYESTVYANNILALSRDQYLSLKCCYGSIKDARGILAGYQAEDVYAVRLPTSEHQPWLSISYVAMQNLMEKLRNSLEDVAMTSSYSFWRKEPLNSSMSKASSGAYTSFVHKSWLYHLNPVERDTLAQIIENCTQMIDISCQHNCSQSVVRCGTLSIPLLPLAHQFVQLSATSSEPLIASAFETAGESNEVFELTLHVEKTREHSQIMSFWWQLDAVYPMVINDTFPFSRCPARQSIKEQSPCAINRNEEYRSLLNLLVFTDRTAPSIIWTLTGGSTLIGLYASVVIIVWRVMRASLVSGVSHSIQFVELPSVDRILTLCNDIYTVRESGELRLEEELFACFLYLYRSSETRIKWTRPVTKLKTATESSPSVPSH